MAEETEQRAQIPFPVVGIGASAGGLESFQQLLMNLPADTGMAFVLVQHLDPHHESNLSPILAKCTSMPVVEVTESVQVAPNRVYVISPNASMQLSQGVLHVTARPEGRGLHLPVDYLFRSLAEEQEARAIGVILSGTGSDGTQGIAEIKANGGITFAEDESTAKHGGMPRSAIESGCVDFIAPPADIAKRLSEIGAHPYLAPSETIPEPVTDEDETEEQYKDALEVVHAVTGVDFSQYRDTTIKRRIMRRMALHTQHLLRDYTDRLRKDRGEVEALYQDLLINVTSFFRDPAMFEALKTTVFPAIVQNRGPQRPVRIWVPGCSTGQEAYSIAIALLEFFDEKPVHPPIQIFATDLSDQERARTGIYPESIESEVGSGRLRRFFVKEDHTYRIGKQIRDICVFAKQNVVADPPFSHVDLISCRNVLIYLSGPLQKRVLPTFHYALNNPGFLVLGTAETVGDSAGLFEMVDRGNKIYVKKAVPHRGPIYFVPEAFRLGSVSGQPGTRAARTMPADFQKEADRIMSGRYAPPGVLLNEDMEILQFRGRTSAYLEPPTGEPTMNVLKMAREGLFMELRSAVTEAKQRNQPVRRHGVRVHAEGGVTKVDLEVIPIRASRSKDECFLVLFHQPGTDPEKPRVPPPDTPPESADPEVSYLRQELAATKEYLQSMVEQQDAINEELQSSNEEILSSNEELQSTNEELETAKEELQSSNEELTTINEQLQQRNLELNHLYNDLINLSASTTIPVIMVGGDLRIRRYTPPARAALGLSVHDVGRPVADIRLSVHVPDLEDLIGEVLRDMQMREREYLDRDGRWRELRLHPYRTTDNKLDGVVIVLHDIDARKRAEEAARNANRQKDEFLATLAHEIRNPLASIRNAVEIMGRAPDSPEVVRHARDVLGRQVWQLTRIVEDLIDVGRIIEKKIRLNREPTSLGELVSTALDTCRAFIQASGHELTVDIPSETLYVDADPVRIVQVLVNLLNNAAKFTEPGGHIGLNVERVPDERNRAGNAVIRVRDDGIGMSESLLPRIFDMFAQGDVGLERRRGGLGVGLTLTRSLVEMHGGSIEALSAGPGQGSEMIVTLPLVERPTREVAIGIPVPHPDQVNARRRRILVVDDNTDHAQSMGMLLGLMGHEARLANDGAAAIDQLSEFKPDLVLLDLGLPGMNGYDVARRIRELNQFRDVVLVAQTGWGREEDRRRSEEAGFDHHIVKPVTPEAIDDIIATIGKKS